MKHSLSLMTGDGKVLPRLKAGLVSLALLTMAGCASVPKVEPPDPTQLDAAGHVRHFQGVTPDQVLAAAETVLRKHRPEASFTHESGTLAMEYEGRFFYVLLGGYELERWGGGGSSAWRCHGCLGGNGLCDRWLCRDICRTWRRVSASGRRVWPSG